MSIQTQIERLTDAKAALKTAIEQKGVAVPEGAPLEQYAPLVEQIADGGNEYSVETVTAEEQNTWAVPSGKCYYILPDGTASIDGYNRVTSYSTVYSNTGIEIKNFGEFYVISYNRSESDGIVLRGAKQPQNGECVLTLTKGESTTQYKVVKMDV